MKSIAVLAFVGAVCSVGFLGAPAMADDVSALLGGQTVGEGDLLGQRAKGSETVTEQEASVINNGTISGYTGANGIAGSFGNSQGLMIVGQNSGNNVSFQQAITMTIKLGN
ncbi:MAG: hypothetical protein U1F33_04110 [Alphaproteobacteria bacterium]